MFMGKRKKTREERQKRIQGIFDSVFDEPFGKKREEAEINITKVLKNNDTLIIWEKYIDTGN